MKYLKLFNNNIDYQNYVKSDDYIIPNVSYVKGSDSVCFTYIPPPQLLDIVYYNGSSLKTIHPSQYNTSMGTAVGVIVIPSDMLPDGKARFIALQDATSSEDTWGPRGELALPDDFYFYIPTTDNAGSTTTGSHWYGYLPSDDTNFTGATSYVDPKTKYKDSTPYIPSPYLEDGSLNPAYCETINGSNSILSDFNGKSNTDVLVGLGTAYTAANAAKNYAVDDIDIDWYLPAAGELGFLVARVASINDSIAIAGGVAVPRNDFWSSTESGQNDVYSVSTDDGCVCPSDKNMFDFCLVRSFALL